MWIPNSRQLAQGLMTSATEPYTTETMQGGREFLEEAANVTPAHSR
jgi:hypothetical protein